MQLSDALEVAIGLSFVFLLLSLVMTAAREAVESFAKVRGARLYEGIHELVADSARREAAADAVKALYDHPQIHGLFRGAFEQALRTRNLPSYIPARNFALALIDQVLAARLDAAPTDASVSPAMTPAERLRLAAERIESEPLRRAVKQAVDAGAGDLDRIRENLEAWYDSAMDRVSGWYRRRTQYFLFFGGLGVAVVLNINALVIADGLAQNATLRRAVAASAEQVLPNMARSGEPAPAASPGAPAKTAYRPEDAIGHIQSLGLPIGWGASGRAGMTQMLSGHVPGAAPPAGFALVGVWITVLLGWFMTGLAVTLGAPFWFDLLNRLVVIRATVKPHEKSGEEASQDAKADGKRLNVHLSTDAASAPVPPPIVGVEDPDPVVADLHPAERPREGDAFEPKAA